VWFVREPAPGPGPLDLSLRVALLHLVVIAPSLGVLAPRWSLLAAALALPFLALGAWGHDARELRDAAILFVSAAACGAAGARDRPPAYLPSVIALLVLPYGLGYLCEEFGAAEAAGTWRRVSPWSLEAGVATLLLWAWPAAALMRRRA